MKNENEKREEETKTEILEDKFVQIIIPECCRLGLPSCPHCVQKPKKLRTNRGL